MVPTCVHTKDGVVIFSQESKHQYYVLYSVNTGQSLTCMIINFKNVKRTV